MISLLVRSSGITTPLRAIAQSLSIGHSRLSAAAHLNRSCDQNTTVVDKILMFFTGNSHALQRLQNN